MDQENKRKYFLNFDNKIKEFILKNPSVIIESINNYQKTIEKKEKEAKKNYLAIFTLAK